VANDLSDLAKLKNLGEKTAGWLYDVGISSREEIELRGVVEVSRLVLLAGHSANVIFCYALEGALTELHWNALGEDRKRELKSAFHEMKRGLSTL